MTVRPILTIGSPLLRVRSEPVPVDEIGGDSTRQLIEDLVDSMRAANGAGLAANQIGVTQRIVVMEVEDNPRYPYKPRIPLTVAINPVVEILDTDLVAINEGCLSVPLRGDVPRSLHVRVQYLDGDGVHHDDEVRGLTAATWQHECDHLDGVLITDRADPSSFTTWEEFEVHHRAAFLDRLASVGVVAEP